MVKLGSKTDRHSSTSMTGTFSTCWWIDVLLDWIMGWPLKDLRANIMHHRLLWWLKLGSLGEWLWRTGLSGHYGNKKHTWANVNLCPTGMLLFPSLQRVCVCVNNEAAPCLHRYVIWLDSCNASQHCWVFFPFLRSLFTTSPGPKPCLNHTCYSDTTWVWSNKGVSLHHPATQ